MEILAAETARSRMRRARLSGHVAAGLEIMADQLTRAEQCVYKQIDSLVATRVKEPQRFGQKALHLPTFELVIAEDQLVYGKQN
ncbi:hypothetical protein E4U21_002537 [Claviceps maximensis]|nr:hypothetical protein E4U21_002537 [Claviceps maximensis]